MAVGSRRSWEAVFGDETIEENLGTAFRRWDQSAPDEMGVSTSSGTTTVYSEREPIWSNSLFARRTLARGTESLHSIHTNLS